jgi:hypothetical protein
VPQRQHDGADHGDQEHQAGDLKEIDVVRVEDVAERGGIAAGGEVGHRGGDRGRQLRREGIAGADDDEFRGQHQADDRADRRIAQRAAPERREVDVEHHHDEEEEHGHGADIDDQQDHRQELGAGEQEQSRRVDEGEDQIEHRMHGVAGRNDHEGRRHRYQGEQMEEDRL